MGVAWITADPAASAVTIRRGDILVADPDFIHATWIGNGVDTSTMQPALWRVDPLTGARELITSKQRGGGPELQAAAGIVIDRAGRITLGDPYSMALFRIDPMTGNRTWLAGAGPDHMAVSALALDRDDSILIADHLQQSIWRVHPETGQRSLVAGPTRGSGPALSHVNEIKVDGKRNLYTLTHHEEGSDLVRIDAGTGDRELISVAGQSNLFNLTALGPIADQAACAAFSSQLIRIDLTNGDRTLVPTSGPRIEKITAMTADGMGRVVAVDEVQGAVFRINLATGQHSLLSGFSEQWGPRLWMPQGIAIAIPEPATGALALLALVVQMVHFRAGCHRRVASGTCDKTCHAVA